MYAMTADMAQTSAGTIGACTNNNMGYAGINQNATLMICKNLDDENLGEYSWWSTSLYYAANNGAKVINMSEGGFDYSKTLKKLLIMHMMQDVCIVASMMNKNNDDNYYPASFKNVMAIGATDTDDSRCRNLHGEAEATGENISQLHRETKYTGLILKIIQIMMYTGAVLHRLQLM